MALWKKFKKFYNASTENRLSIKVFFGFVILPVLAMIGLYIWVKLFWL